MDVEPAAYRWADLLLERHPEWTDHGGLVEYRTVDSDDDLAHAASFDPLDFTFRGEMPSDLPTEVERIDYRTDEDLEAVPDEHASFIGFDASTGELVPLPEEVVLRELLELDTDDPVAVVEFLRQFGGPPNHFPARELDGFDMPNWASFRNIRDRLAEQQRLVRHWLAARKGQDVRQVWDGELDHRECWRRWAFEMDLAGVAPTISVTSSEGFQSERWNSQWGVSGSLWRALSLQLAQLVHEKPRFRTCEQCGRDFYRQRGRAKKGQHRKKAGVKYCSAKCSSTAQTQRDRQRQKEKSP